MRRNHKHPMLLLLSAVAVAPVTYADTIIFSQDFDSAQATQPNWTATGTGNLDGPSATQNPATGTNPAGNLQYNNIAKRVVGTNTANVKESIFVGSGSSAQNSAPSNFSVTPRNWDIHDGSSAINISGYRGVNGTTNVAMNSNMSGNMMGTVVTSTALPDANEQNFYQLAGLKLDAVGSTYNGMKLTFDFDSFIWPDGDGFAVTYATSTDNGATYTAFSLLNPTAASAMQYRTLAGVNQKFGELTNQLPTVADRGFDGGPGTGTSPLWNNTAGTAIFDLSGLAGKTIALRFSYASNGNTVGSADGINIDNIKITETCTNGSTGNCTPGTPGVPEPASMALVLLGVTAAYRRRPRQQS